MTATPQLSRLDALAWAACARAFEPVKPNPYLTDPVGWVENRLGEHLWSRQQDIARSVVEHRRTAVKSCHNAGKSFLASRIAAWWIDVHPPGEAFVVSTAPSYAQVHAILWEEIRAAAKQAATKGDPLLGRVLGSDVWKLNDGQIVGWGRKPADTDQHGFQGIHRRYVLVVIDEACGVPRQLWTAVEAITTGAGCRILAIGNPDDPNSEFGDVCKPGSGWNVIGINAFDTPNFTNEPFPENLRALMLDPDWVEDKRKRWGEDSPRYVAKILGEFPDIGVDTLFPPSMIEAAQLRQLDPVGRRILGVDVARYGCFDDQTEILTSDGWKLFVDVKGSENVLSLDCDTAKWMPITQVHAYPFDGYLNEYNARGASFAITDNHSLVTRPPKGTDWRLARFDALSRFSILRRGSTWAGLAPDSITFEEATPMPNGGTRDRTWTFAWPDFCEFVGWFVAEGFVYRERRKGERRRICIGQRGATGRFRIEELLGRLGLPWYYGGGNYQVSCRSLADWLEANCEVGAANKRIPETIRNTSVEGIERFLDGYREGDGWRNATGGATYSTTSPRLVGDLQEILVKVGRCGGARLVAKAGSTTQINGRAVVRKHDIWNVGEFKRPTDIHLDKTKIQRVPYVGMVYCVSTPYRTILVRRKGCVMWSGNSDRSVIYLRHGPVIRLHSEYSKLPTTETTGRVIAAKRETQADEIRVDGVGVGAGVVDQLTEQGLPVLDMQAGARAVEPDRFVNQRAEWAWNLRDLLEEGTVDLDAGDDELAAQLGALKFRYDSRGRIVVESKDEARKRGLPSPDRADAAILTAVAPAGTDLFRPLNWRYFHRVASSIPGQVDCGGRISTLVEGWVYCSAYIPAGEDAGADWAVAAVWCQTIHGDLLLLDLARRRLGDSSPADLLAPLVRTHRADTVFIAKKQLTDTVRAQGSRAGVGFTAVDAADADLYARALTASSTVVAGRVWLSAGAPWLGPFVAQCMAYPHGRTHGSVSVLALAAQVQTTRWQPPPRAPAAVASAWDDGPDFMTCPM